MKRTHYNGLLTINDVGQSVSLFGWVAKKRNLGSLLFIDLRDRTGIVQLLVKDPSSVPDIRNEYVIHVTGIVSKKDVPNPNLKTGSIEIIVSDLKVISSAQTTPMIIDNQTDALEETRLKYRYLDIRRPIMQEKLIARSKIVKLFHEYLDDQGFIEVETPILTLSTPGGARDYLVPSRLQHGSFYALPQSPQIYKQLLMIGGMERYYQVARCFRDEDLRADRQPDFTQIDIEASFIEQDEFLSLMEPVLVKIWSQIVKEEIQLPLAKYTYEHVVTNYGSDRPDLRFDLPLVDVKPLLSKSSFEGFMDAKYIKGIILKNHGASLSRKLIDELNLELRKFGLKPAIVLKVSEGVLSGSFTKYLDEQLMKDIISEYKLTENDALVLTSGDEFKTFHFGMGALRNLLAKQFKLIDEGKTSMFWVTEFPLFEKSDNGGLSSSHHPFTRPLAEDIPLLDSEPLKVRSAAYDIVINGYEAGGGSMRIYDKSLQQKIFELLGMSEEDIKRKFGWFIEAFNYGTPPHGGIAFGLDRLTMIVTKTDNIRDVIAFPKNLSAIGPLEKTPAPVDESQLDELGIVIKKENK
ncbi:MAG TPA: aspartate--tRNA ligase [Bacilli bacterium]|nr:aspartate--tRNA ligase [Bacilli bacterium]